MLSSNATRQPTTRMSSQARSDKQLPSPANSDASMHREDGLSALMELISAMSTDTIDDLLAKRKAPNTSVDLSDDDIALALFAEEAEGLLNFAKDHRVEGAVDEGLLDELMELEEMAHYDHLMAIALSQGKEPPPRPHRVRGKQRYRIIVSRL